MRGTDPGRPGEAWWFTVGGGRGAGEDPREAAVRELREETGLAVAPGDLTGPVWARTADFQYLGRACRQREEFFVLRLGAGARLSRAGWTALELATLTDVRWWHPGELAASGDTCYPADLPALLAELPPAWTGPPRAIG